MQGQVKKKTKQKTKKIEEIAITTYFSYKKNYVKRKKEYCYRIL